jgi:hypothetical protein
VSVTLCPSERENLLKTFAVTGMRYYYRSSSYVVESSV